MGNGSRGSTYWLSPRGLVAGIAVGPPHFAKRSLWATADTESLRHLVASWCASEVSRHKGEEVANGQLLLQARGCMGG